MTMEEWLLTRPDCVQKLAAEFPFGMAFDFPDGALKVIGWNESDCVLMAPLDADTYEKAIAQKRYIHAACLREAML